MKHSILIAIILFNYAFAKAQSNPTPKVEAPQIALKLAYGEMADLGEVQLKFKEVLSDSRCPKNVQCVWAGEAKVRIELYKSGNLDGERVITFGAIPKAIEILTSDVLDISAMYLKPYPQTQTPKDNREYYLLLNVTEH